MTSPDHATGTDRLAEAARSIEAEVIVNVQGDEPMLDPAGIDAAAKALLDDPALPMATLSLPLRSAEEMLAPVGGQGGGRRAGRRALLLAQPRSPTCASGPRPTRAPRPRRPSPRGLARKHVGLYAYRREALLRFASLPPRRSRRPRGSSSSAPCTTA